ncbi:MAG TPA: glycosyltransferase domain-containing protein [Pirellulaceae bacterium]|nr:glycosyltransferase domain-containing protein [Pirellulaceae bacterium]
MKQLCNPLLTIGMATFDDFDGVYFTITSLMLHHADVMSDCNIVVVDNNPRSRHGKSVKDWVERRVPKGEYFAYEGATGTAQARNEVFRRAKSQAVLCIDCHVLLVPEAIRKLIDYYRANPDCRDLLSGPLLMDSGELAATHQRPQWSNEAWGVWSVDERGRDRQGQPFEIWQQGMGLFSCRKDAWVGFHPEFRGFGGCESYVMEKFRSQGGRVLCCPWLGWTHRFQRPSGVAYDVSKRDKLRNYVIGFQELGIDIKPALEHFKVTRDEAQRLVLRNQPSPSVTEIAIVGVPSYGGVKMRGNVLSRYLSCKLITPRQVQGMGRRDSIVAVKNGFCTTTIRHKCDRLIYDPLDDFCSSRMHGSPMEYWRSRFRELTFDEIIATSPACHDVMREALPAGVQVHLVPHQCDPKINASWADTEGPIVYAGLRSYIKTGLDRIKQACRMVGRDFVMGETCDVLRGASLVLALRLPPYDTELNRHCKPQIKIANAHAAGLPVVSTDCPSTTSLCPGIQTVAVDFSAAELADAMQRAFASPKLSNPPCTEDYLTAMDRILGRETMVVYTAIFGGYDQLRDPLERLPGTQYVCFTDNPRLKSDVWSIRYCPPSGDPQMQAKACKILAHEVLDCTVSLWLDGRIELQSLNGALQSSISDLALRRHPQRNCIYAEGRHCKLVGRGDPSRIDEAIARYEAEGHPARYGLWQGGIILRRHTPATRAFNLEWWGEVTRGTSRDQISLPVVLRRLGITFDTLPPDLPRCRIGNHLRENIGHC